MKFISSVIGYKRLDKINKIIKITNIYNLNDKINKYKRKGKCFKNGMEEGRRAFKILTDKPLGGPRPRWEDNIRMNLEEIGINAGNWVDSAQDRDYWRALVNAALNLRVP